jgi:hypothetical protein
LLTYAQGYRLSFPISNREVQLSGYQSEGNYESVYQVNSG